jgi:predicted amidohydrolase
MATKAIHCAVISTNARSVLSTNVASTFELIRQAAAAGPTDWVSVPEVFDFIGTPADVEGIPASRHDWLVEQLSKLAVELKVILFAGSIHEPSGITDEPRSFNTSYVFDRSGNVIAKYRKIHLFELRDRNGEKSHSESENFLPGEAATVCSVDGLQVGLSICYDLRFTGLYERIHRLGRPDVLMVPAAFTRLTGQAHWEILLRARAIEYQCYVVAANQCGIHGIGKESFGHAMIVDPWGEKLCDSGEKPGFCHAVIDPAKISEVRARLPALNNRRVDLYY